MKTIGIYGHRGAGKKTVAAMLGIVLESLFDTDNRDDVLKRSEKFRDACRKVCKGICHSEEELERVLDIPFHYVSYSAFKEVPLSLIQGLTGISMADLDKDAVKDNMYICLDTLKTAARGDVTGTILTAKEAFAELKDLPIDKQRAEIWMVMREFIIYFGYELMQRFFGTNVWVSSITQADVVYNTVPSSSGFNIFTDVKTEKEAEYIKSCGGVLIKVNNPNHKKGRSFVEVDIKPDYEVNIQECTPEGLSLTMMTDLSNVAIEIYNTFYGKD